MPRDWSKIVEVLERKAGDPRTPAGEADASRAKAAEIRALHAIPTAPPRGPERSPVEDVFRRTGQPYDPTFEMRRSSLQADLDNLFATFGGVVAEAMTLTVVNGGAAFFGTGEGGGLTFAMSFFPPGSRNR